MVIWPDINAYIQLIDEQKLGWVSPLVSLQPYTGQSPYHVATGPEEGPMFLTKTLNIPNNVELGHYWVGPCPLYRLMKAEKPILTIFLGFPAPVHVWDKATLFSHFRYSRQLFLWQVLLIAMQSLITGEFPKLENFNHSLS